MKNISVFSSLSLILIITACSEPPSLLPLKYADIEEKVVMELEPDTILLEEGLLTTYTEGNWKLIGKVTRVDNKLNTTPGNTAIFTEQKGKFKYPLSQNGGELHFQWMQGAESSISVKFNEAEVFQLKNNVVSQDTTLEYLKAYGLWNRSTINYGVSEDSLKIYSFSINGKNVLSNYLINTSNDDLVFSFNSEAGPLALRALKEKRYSANLVVIDQLKYKLYEYPDASKIPDFDSLELVDEGICTTIDPHEFTEKKNNFAVEFNGQITIPADDTYLFISTINEGGTLAIDGKEIIYNEKTTGRNSIYVSVELKAGIYPIYATFYQAINNYKNILFITSNSIKKQMIGNTEPIEKWKISKEMKLLETVSDKPKIIRSFASYMETKLTHAISVGFKEKENYTYDLNTGSLVKAWHGEFADVRPMWHGRGTPQLLIPLNIDVQFPFLGIHLPLSETEMKYRGYSLENGIPTYKYMTSTGVVKDKIIANSKGLSRKITLPPSMNLDTYVIAQGGAISEVSKGLYSIDADYFIQYDGNATIVLDGQQLIAEKNNLKNIEYKILW